MKGLLIKDFGLMKGQKNFFFLMIAIAIGMAAFLDGSTFMLSYLPFVLSLFTLSTISYDEFDNGNAFLFTLPVSRTEYAIEKYCLAFLLGCGAWVFALFFAGAFGVIRETATIRETVMTAVMILPVLMMLQAVMIPFQLKFGGEKGRIALIGVFGLLFVCATIAVKAARLFGIDPENVINSLPTVSMGIVIAIMFIAAVIVLLISAKISSTIMNNKEF